MPSTKIRDRALVTCTAFAGALLFAQAHHAFADHGFCTAHGEPIHLHEGDGHGPRLLDRPALHRDHRVAGVHGCPAQTFLETPSSPPVGLRERSKADSVRTAPRPLRTHVFPSIPLLREAPKHSPPA